MTADTFSNTLGFLIMGTGNDNNSWGGNANTSVFQILEDAIANALTSTVTGGTLDLSGSPPPAAASQVRYAALIFNGTLGSNQIIQVPNLTKFWFVQNATAGAFTLKIKTSAGSASTAIPQNSGWQLVQCDGANGITVSPFNSKQVQMPDGTVALPAFSNVTEPSSGWYRAGAQDWRLSINGVDVLQATGTGAGTPSILNVISPGALQVGGVQYVPAGVEVHYAGITAPAGWIFVYGQAISRTGANANLFAAITTTVVGNTNNNTSITGLASDMRGLGLGKAFVEGTGIATGTTITFTGATTATLSAGATGSNVGITLRILPHGQGDASTTFNVPDRRGVATFGRDDMNGTARSLITVAGGNFDGTLLGINRAAADLAGGAQNHALTTGEMPVHNHGTTETGHVHGILADSNGGFTQGGAGLVVQRVGVGASGGPTNSNSATTGLTINNAGSGSAHTIMPPAGVSNVIMKL